jgi:hypothetical protein
VAAVRDDDELAALTEWLPAGAREGEHPSPIGLVEARVEVEELDATAAERGQVDPEMVEATHALEELSVTGPRGPVTLSSTGSDIFWRQS